MHVSSPGKRRYCALKQHGVSYVLFYYISDGSSKPNGFVKFDNPKVPLAGAWLWTLLASIRLYRPVAAVLFVAAVSFFLYAIFLKLALAILTNHCTILDSADGQTPPAQEVAAGVETGGDVDGRRHARPCWLCR